jgi:hypothetical protein
MIIILEDKVIKFHVRYRKFYMNSCTHAHTHTILLVYADLHYTSRHQIACFKATEGLHPPYRSALNHQYSVASFATLLVLRCLHSSGLRCSCCNIVRFYYDLAAYIVLVLALISYVIVTYFHWNVVICELLAFLFQQSSNYRFLLPVDCLLPSMRFYL